MGCCFKKKDKSKLEEKLDYEDQNIPLNKDNNEQALKIEQTNNENKDTNIKVEEREEEDDDDWLRKHGKPITKKDTSGRISLLFYGPCFSGKSAIFNYIEKVSPNESSGAYVGVAFFKKSIQIKNLEVKVDCYDIGSYNGNQNKKAWFIERCNLFLLIFDPTNEECENQINECLNKIKSRNNKDPCKICLCATKTDLLNDVNILKLEQIQNNFKDYKFYKLNKNSGEKISQMFLEFIEDNYDDIKETLKGIDELDIINSEDYSYMDNLVRILNSNMIHQ